MAEKKRKPPSRIKYENNNPTVSIRIDRAVKAQLDELRIKSGKSLGDILREAVQVQAPSTREAFTRGIEEGKSIYGVSFRCSGCQNTSWIDSPELKDAATQIMEKYGWGHKECVGAPTKIEFWGAGQNGFE